MGDVGIFCDVAVKPTTELLQYLTKNRMVDKATMEIIVTTMAMFNTILVEDPRVATPTKVLTNDIVNVPTNGDITKVETKARVNQGKSQCRPPKQHIF